MAKHNLLFSAVERNSRVIIPHCREMGTRTQERQVTAAMRKGQKQNPPLPTGEHSFPGLDAPDVCRALSSLLAKNGEDTGSHAVLQHKVPWSPGKGDAKAFLNFVNLDAEKMLSDGGA